MDRYTRREFLRATNLTLTGIITSPLVAAATRPNKKHPNVLILKSDEHNPLVSSVHGHPFVKTPNMTRLARMGTVFENHYCPSPLCCPSRSAFISGRRVHEIQTYNNSCFFKFDYPSYGAVLKAQGIHTVYIGKVDAYNFPNKLGFSEMHGNDVRNPGDTKFGRNPLMIRKGAASRQSGYGVKSDAFIYDNIEVARAISWIKTKGISMEKPWTMEVNIIKPHFPHHVSKELWDLYADHGDLPEHSFDCESAKHLYAKDLQDHFETRKFTEESIRGLRRGYYGCVTYVDNQLGQLLDVLEETGLLDNTIVAYTSDHGEMLGKFGMWWKSSLYEDSARVPLIVAGPGFKKNTRVKTPVDQLALQASIFYALRCKQPEDWSGEPLQTIKENDQNHVAFCEYHGHGTRASAFMVRKGKWKYIGYVAAQNQLFNMEDDPDELHNLFETLPGVVEDMEKELRAICDPEKENTRAEEFINKELAALKK